MMEYSVYSPFDANKHAEHFINYLEVIIHPDGSVHYAVPSHQGYLIDYICKRDGITEDELNNMCPSEYYYDFMTWLCMKSGCISVWNEFGCWLDQATPEQVKTMKMLKDMGLYKGEFE